MHVLKRSTVMAYSQAHASTRAALMVWLKKAEDAKWSQSNDVLNDIKSAKILNSERVRFEIGSNHRLIAAIHYPSKALYIKFIGTHAEYDRVDALNVDLY